MIVVLVEVSPTGEVAEVSLEASWNDPDAAVNALMERRLAGKAVLTFDKD